MATRPRHDKLPGYEEVSAEHQALKTQIAALRREHEQLHTVGGTKAAHKQHIDKLRAKIKELEEHVGKLRKMRRSNS